jgi:hypothetical protein
VGEGITVAPDAGQEMAGRQSRQPVTGVAAVVGRKSPLYLKQSFNQHAQFIEIMHFFTR